MDLIVTKSWDGTDRTGRQQIQNTYIGDCTNSTYREKTGHSLHLSCIPLSYNVLCSVMYWLSCFVYCNCVLKMQFLYLGNGLKSLSHAQYICYKSSLSDLQMHNSMFYLLLRWQSVAKVTTYNSSHLTLLVKGSSVIVTNFIATYIAINTIQQLTRDSWSLSILTLMGDLICNH